MKEKTRLSFWRCVIIVIGFMIVFILASELHKLCTVEKRCRVYAIRHTVATGFVNTCTSHKNVVVAFRNTLNEYESLLNRYGVSGHDKHKEHILKINEQHKSMISVLHNKTDELERLVDQHFSNLGNQYRIDLGTIQEIEAEIVKNIDFVTCDNPQQYVFFEGLPLALYADMTQLETITDNLLENYNFEKMANYKEYMRKDEMKSQHAIGALASLITLFFYITTIIPLWRKKQTHKSQ